MKKKICAAVAAAVLLMSAVSLPASAASVDQFTDVKPGDWYYEAVDYAVSEGLFSGTEAGKFSPNSAMTRGMFVTVLGRKSGVDPNRYREETFRDVSAGSYYAPYVNWAAENGIVSGMGDGIFKPNDPVTREQIAKILYGYAQKTGNDASYQSERFNYFRDRGNASKYAVESLKWASTHMIINGTNDGYLGPGSRATRCEVAQIFLNADQLLVNTEITDTPEPTDERITISDKDLVPLYSMPIPSTWKDRYAATAGSDGLSVTFYSSNNLYTGHGGKLFSLKFYTNAADYQPIPSTHLVTRVKHNGTVYDVVYQTPTDVQFGMEYQNEYLQMQADIPRMIDGMEFLVPEV